MPRERDVNGKRLKRHRFQETAMTSGKACQERRVCQVSGSRVQSCRQEGLSRFRNVRSKPDQEKVAALDKDVESKKCQGQRLPRDHAVDGRASHAVRRCSYRLSLVFKGSSLSRNFRHPACPGSTSIAWCCRYCKHVRTLGDAWARCCTGGSSWLRGRQWQYKR